MTTPAEVIQIIDPRIERAIAPLLERIEKLEAKAKPATDPLRYNKGQSSPQGGR